MFELVQSYCEYCKQPCNKEYHEECHQEVAKFRDEQPKLKNKYSHMCDICTGKDLYYRKELNYCVECFIALESEDDIPVNVPFQVYGDDTDKIKMDLFLERIGLNGSVGINSNVRV